MGTLHAFPARTLFQRVVTARAIAPALEPLRLQPAVAAAPTPRVLPWMSGDRCHHCGGRSFWIGRITAECAQCSWAASLSSGARP